MLRINVGLNKKGTKDFNSAGLSINIEAELDSGLLARPAELQAQIDDLYAQAHEALDRQAAAVQPAPQAAQPARSAPATRPAARPVGATSSGYPRGAAPARSAPAAPSRAGVGPATASQMKAIGSIGRQLDVDPAAVAADMGFDPQRLDLKQASALIDALKSMQAPSTTAR